jgi:hypothetical protein
MGQLDGLAAALQQGADTASSGQKGGQAGERQAQRET